MQDNLENISLNNLSKPVAKSADLRLLASSAQAAFMSAAEGLVLVENKILESLSSEAESLTEISKYLLTLGGKRIRPLLVILTSKLFKKDTPDLSLLCAASGIELIHMATLLHDDIIDRSATRRGKPSAYLEFGADKTLLTGDFLLVKAFGLCAQLDRFVIESTEKACIALTEGEILEEKLSSSKKIALNSYLNVIKKKTASLFSLSCAVGAHLSDASKLDVNALYNFGEISGICFQMIDDILDVTANEDLLGKPSGTDLKQRTASLVNILWLNSEDPYAKKFFSYEEVSEVETKEALLKLKDSDIISQARKIASEYAKQAKSHLLNLEGNICQKTREQLFAIVDYTLERCL